MTLYLTDRTDPAEIEQGQGERRRARLSNSIRPAPRRTRMPVSPISRVWTACSPRMAEVGMVAAGARRSDRSGGGRVRPRGALHRSSARPAHRAHPRLRVVFEHITTTRCRASSCAARARGIAATVTPQHLLLNRNALFAGGIRPHLYCLPVLKSEARPQRAARLRSPAATPRLFLGTDSAPHARHTKENACGCAGIFSAHAAHRAVRTGFRGGRCTG